MDVDPARRQGAFRTKSNWLMGGDVPVSDATEGYRRERFRTTANDSQRGATSGRTPNPPERIGGAVHGEPNSFVFVWPQRTVSVYVEVASTNIKSWN